MQKLFKRSLAWVLSIMMVVTMFSGMTFASAAEPYTSNEPASVGSLWHMADLLATDASYNQYNNMHYLAQEFVPGTDTISGVDLQFLITGGTGVMHLELRKDDPNSTAVWSKDIPFVSRGNRTAWYEFDFGEDVAVTAGDTYYLGYWLASKNSAGNSALYQGAAATGGHTVYLGKMFTVDGENVTLNAPTNLAQNGNAIPFRIKSGTGVNTLLSHADSRDPVRIPAGNTGLGGVQGQLEDTLRTEGLSSNKSNWGTVEVGATNKLFYSDISVGGKDLTKAKYVTFDMYVHGFEWNPDSVSTPTLYFGTQAGQWGSGDLMNFKIGSFLPETLNNDAWHTIVLPLETATWNATPTNVQVFSVRWDGGNAGENAVKFTATDAYVLFDNFRALDETAYTIQTQMGKVDEVEELIAALPAVADLTLEDKAQVDAAQAAYDALADVLKPYVSNKSVLDAAQAQLVALTPVNVVFRDFETAGSLANEGSVNRTAVDGLDGNAVKFEHTAEKTGGIFWYFYPVDHDGANAGGIDIAGAEYITFDMYVSDATLFTYSGDYRINIYSTDGSTDCGQVAAADVANMFKGLKNGWNHVVMPVSLTDGAPTTAWKLRLYSSSGSAQAGAYTIVDDMRFVNKLALDTVIAGRTVAKDATIAINAIPAIDALTLDDKATVEAAATAYAAVADEYKSVVKGADTLTAAQAKIAELENPVEDDKVIYDESLYNLDTVKGLAGSRAGITTADTKNFTEGSGSHYVAIGDNNVANFELLVYGTNENGSNATTNTRDISKFINEDGEFYVTFDMYVSDPSIVTKNRFMLGMGCYTDNCQSISGTCLALNANTQSGKNATWADFGLADGVKAGWNKLAIKMDCSDDSVYLEGADPTRWDATQFRFIRLYADGFTAAAANQVRFDDVRIMTVDAYEANFAARNAAKDVVIAINELPADATATDDAVVAIKEAYAALSDEQKAMVSNYSVVENIETPAEPLDVQLHAMDQIDMQIIAVGNTATNGVQGTIVNNNYTEGTGAHFSNWSSSVEVGAVEKLYLSLTNLPNVDFSVADYLSFDIYLHNFEVTFPSGTAGTDCNLGLGSTNDWGSSDLFTYGNQAFGAYANEWKEGWNHVVLPIDTNATNVKNLKIYFEWAVTITGESPYVLFDDFRLLNNAALAADTDRTAAKAVIAQIAALDATDDAAIAAADEAYKALTEAQQAYVTNYNVITVINATKKAAADVVAAIKGLQGSTFMFNDCNSNTDEGGTEIVANYNSGALDKEITAEGYAKYILKADGAPDFPMTFRNGEGVVPANYSELVFDIYVSEGMEIVTGSWGNTHYQTAYGSIDEHKVDSLTLAAAFEQLVPGQWNTVRLTVSTSSELIKQITLRPYGIFKGAAGEYVLVDNVRFEYTNEITYADKAAVAAVQEAYEALSDEGKALVTNAADLEEMVAYMTAQETAAAAVVNAINALPPISVETDSDVVDVLDLDDEAAVDAAEKALAALEADTKAALVSAEVEATLTAARARIEEIKAASDVGQLCAPVVSAIDALPAVEDVRTSDEAAITSANDLYTGLSEEAKAHMAENFADQVAKLEAVVAELANEKQFEADAQPIIAVIDALPETVKVADEEAVNAAKAAYDEASADVQYYVTNKAVLDAAVAALATDKADKAAADALTERIFFLLAIDKVLEADVEWIQGMYADYTALSDNAKAYIPEESVKALEEAYTASRMFGPIDVQYRGFNKFGADINRDGNAGKAATYYGKDTEQPLEGNSSLAIKWDAATQGEFHMFIYHYNQGNGWTTANFDGEGCWEVPCPSAKTGTINAVLDLYVSDPAVIRNASGDCGFGYDVKQPNQWGNGGSVNKAKLMAAFDAANNGEGLKAGWNQVIIPMSFGENFAGQVLTFYDLRFYFLGATIPAGFTMKIDDLRFMNQEAIETILPERNAAKDVTKAIYALAEDYTYEDGSAIINAYETLTANQDLVVGYDAFLAAFSEKFAEEIAADKAAAQTVVDQIDDMYNGGGMFNDCETLVKDGLEVVANLNSGADNKELAEGQGIDGGNAAKFIKKADGACEFNEAFRVSEPYSFVGAETLEFDLYISEGMTINTNWSPVCFQSGHANNCDTNKVGSFDLKNVMGEWKAGQWNHVVVPLDGVLSNAVREAGISQICIRLYNTLSGAAGEYILIDNLRTTGIKAITLDDKATVEEIETAYDALTDAQKGYVENYADLVAARETIDALEKAAQEAADKEAAAAVDALIAALPAEITLEAKADVAAARAAYDALTDAQKAYVEGLATLEAAEKAIADLEQDEADKAAAAAVDALIEAFPEEVTPDNADQVNAAKAAYDALTDAQKALVKDENVTALEAALEAIVAPQYKLGDIDGDGAVSAADALEALKSVVGKITLTETQALAGDVNLDGQVNAEDALEILKEVVGKENCF